MKSLLPLILPLALTVPAAAQQLTVELMASGMGRVTDMRQAPGDDDRYFVTTTNRGVYVFQEGQAPSYFLDLQDMDPPLHLPHGLMSLEFHPDYRSNGKFYILYMDADLVTHLVQYTVSADPDVADPDSGVHILGPFQQPNVVHNWNCLQFGSDGMLYVSTGDGVDSADPVTSNSQDLGSILGKVLRLDVDLPAPHAPADNPFVGVPGADERVWMYGLRQPWRFAFDRLTNDFYLADVGNGHFEELNFLPASGGLGGQNFGWRCMEGTRCWNFAGCNPMCNDPGWVVPFYEFPHDGRCAIIGGYVYRGDAIPALQGSYFFGDYCSGEMYAVRYDGSRITEFVDRTSQLTPAEGEFRLTSFAEDNAGELFIMDWDGGQVWKIVSADDCTVNRYCPPSPNSVGPGAEMTTNGETSVSANNLELGGVFLPPNEIGIFIYGAQQNNAPFGNGTLCLTGIQRIYPPAQIDANGRTNYQVDLNAPPADSGPGQITTGSTWNFQLWYRDPMGSPATFNGSDALEITFCP